jgi:hypothetical protein
MVAERAYRIHMRGAYQLLRTGAFVASSASWVVVV